MGSEQALSRNILWLDFLMAHTVIYVLFFMYNYVIKIEIVIYFGAFH